MTDNYIVNSGLDWKNCVGVCTDGAPAMAGKYDGLQARIRRKNPNVTWHHCMIHRESLVSKEISPGLHLVLSIVISVVNYIKTRPLRARLFS